MWHVARWATICPIFMVAGEGLSLSLCFSCTGGHRLCLKAPGNVHLPHQAGTFRLPSMCRLGEQAQGVAGPRGPDSGTLALIFSQSLNCSCQMALHFKSPCLSITGQRRESTRPNSQEFWGAGRHACGRRPPPAAARCFICSKVDSSFPLKMCLKNSGSRAKSKGQK